MQIAWLGKVTNDILDTKSSGHIAYTVIVALGSSTRITGWKTQLGSVQLCNL